MEEYPEPGSSMMGSPSPHDVVSSCAEPTSTMAVVEVCAWDEAVSMPRTTAAPAKALDMACNLVQSGRSNNVKQ